MADYYRIINITDHGDMQKIDPEVIDRIGRIVELKWYEPGVSVLMECIVPGPHKSIITSPLRKMEMRGKNVTLTTENSKYFLEKVDSKVVENESRV